MGDRRSESEEQTIRTAGRPPLPVRRVEESDWAEWLRMRAALWPDCPADKHEQEMRSILSPHSPVSRPEKDRQGEGLACFVAERAGGGLGGFIEVGLRNYAEGCDSSPVGYIEGWYVDPDLRRQGIGAALVQSAEAWARAQGCSEMASDCQLDNDVSFRAHLALGYAEAERTIHFCKRL